MVALGSRPSAFLDGPREQCLAFSFISFQAPTMAEASISSTSWILTPNPPDVPSDTWLESERLLGEPSPTSPGGHSTSLEDSLLDALERLQEERSRNARLQLQVDVARALSAPGQCTSRPLLCAVRTIQRTQRCRALLGHEAAVQHAAARLLARESSAYIARLRSTTKTQIRLSLLAALARVDQLERQESTAWGEATTSAQAVGRGLDQLQQQLQQQIQEQQLLLQAQQAQQAQEQTQLRAELSEANARCASLAAKLEHHQTDHARLMTRVAAAVAANAEQVEAARLRDAETFRLSSENAALLERLSQAEQARRQAEERASRLQSHLAQNSRHLPAK